MLLEALIDHARKRGKTLAVSDPTVSLTYRRLAKFAQVMRAEVNRASRAPRVGIMLPASAAFSGCLFGAWWASRTAVPLNFLLSAPELKRVVEAAELDLVISVRNFESLGRALGVRVLYLEDLPLKRRMFAALWKPLPRVPAVNSEETAVLLFTSGTSAEPKGVELSFANLRSNCDDCIATANMHAEHRFLNCLPPFHVFGLTANVLIPIVLGAASYCIPRFQPVAIVKAIRLHRISVLLAIPSMYAAILRLKSAPADLMRDIDLAISGGEPLPEAVAKGYRARFGIDLLQGYGLTETSPVCTLETPRSHKPGSIGRPIRNVEMRIVRSDGQPVDPGREGEIQVRGPNVMKGYYRDPEGTRAAITPEGWFITGDNGRQDVEGFVTITGRLKEMMIIGGENVYPREIETALEAHSAVAEAAVIGIPDASRGETPVAFVTCVEGAEVTAQELRAFVRQRLAGYKVPRQVRIENELPRTPVGKILKRKLVGLL